MSVLNGDDNVATSVTEMKGPGRCLETSGDEDVVEGDASKEKRWSTPIIPSPPKLHPNALSSKSFRQCFVLLPTIDRE